MQMGIMKENDFRELSIDICERYGGEYILRQLAEECSELAHAALKLIRAQRDETPVNEVDALKNLVEEIADVSIMSSVAKWTVLSRSDRSECSEIKNRKIHRMELRMLKKLSEDGGNEESESRFSH